MVLSPHNTHTYTNTKRAPTNPLYMYSMHNCNNSNNVQITIIIIITAARSPHSLAEKNMDNFHQNHTPTLSANEQKKTNGTDRVKMKRWRCAIYTSVGKWLHIRCSTQTLANYRNKWKLTIISWVWYNFQHKRKFIATKCLWDRCCSRCRPTFSLPLPFVSCLHSFVVSYFFGCFFFHLCLSLLSSTPPKMNQMPNIVRATWRQCIKNDIP